MVLSLGLLGGLGGLGGLGACGEGEGQGGPPPADRRRPNVVMILTDQHRADLAGFAGDREAHTPNLDRLAREGIVLDALYCHNPICTPARQSLITGLPSHAHGWFGNVARFPVDQPTLVAHWARHGYQTAMIGKGHMNTHDFESVVEQAAMFAAFRGRHPDGRKPGAAAVDDDASPFSTVVRQANPGLLGPGAEPVHFMERDVVSEAGRWLDGRDTQRPFFLWVSFTRPHPPRFPPTRWLDRYRERTLERARDHAAPATPQEREGMFEYAREMRARAGLDQLGEREREGIVRAYYASVAFVDEQIGEVLGLLDQRGLAADTLVVYTSDHGEMLLDHGLLGKSALYEEAIRVPGILRLPGTLPAGERLAAVCQHADLMATLFELAGLPDPAGGVGRSLAPWMTGQGAGWRDEALVELFLWNETHQTVPRERISASLRVGDLKYVWYREQEQALYDLAADPRELRNLIADPAHRPDVERLRARLRERVPESVYVMRRPPH